MLVALEAACRDKAIKWRECPHKSEELAVRDIADAHRPLRRKVGTCFAMTPGTILYNGKDGPIDD